MNIERQFEDDTADLNSEDDFASGIGLQAEFIRLFASHHSDVLAFIYKLVHNRHDADDVFQRTSMVLWSKIETFEPGSNFLAWANKIAYFQVCNFFRTSGRDRLRFSDAVLAKIADESTVPIVENQGRLDALSKCMNELGRSDRDVVRQAYSGEQSVKELAVTIGLAVQTVYNRLGRIRKQLFLCVAQKLAIVEESQ